MIQLKEDMYRLFCSIVGVWTDDHSGPDTADNMNRWNSKHHWFIVSVQTDDHSD